MTLPSWALDYPPLEALERLGSRLYARSGSSLSAIPGTTLGTPCQQISMSGLEYEMASYSFLFHP